VARPPVRPPDLRAKIFRGSTVVRAGRLTRAQLRTSAWRRLFPDVYACASLPPTHRLRTAAAARVLVPGAVVCGRSAATLWGVPLAGPEDDVELVVPPTCRAGAAGGLRVTRRALPAQDVTHRHGLAVTTPLRTALDLGRLPLDDAVVAIDRFLLAGLVALDDLRDAAAGTSGPGCRQVRRAAGLADGLAGSPQETRLRLVLVRSRLPAPVAQYVVRDADGFVARVDFAWPEHRVALEYEGVWHGERQQVARDRRRLNRLSAAGWQVVFVTAEDLRRPEQLIARIAAALGARAYV
jgi:very-short-patch-repair endonuclease